jgi:acetolactate decarboxylase
VVGFYLPGYMSGLNMPGYHLHFISDDRKSGGHILDLEAGPNTTIELDGTPQLFASIPEAGNAKIDTGKDVSADLAKVER